jgi:hypothetical protein
MMRVEAVAMDRSTLGRKERSDTQDVRGVPVSCSDGSALELYEKALLQYHSYVGDPIVTIAEALKHAPDFVLGHVFRATVLMTFTERRFASYSCVRICC